MNFCVVPDKELFLKIDDKMKTFMTKLTDTNEDVKVFSPE